MRYFKILDGNGRSARDQEWPLPQGKRPGQWLRTAEDDEGELIPYVTGYHVYTPKQLLDWTGPTIWEVEVRRRRLVDAGHMTVVRSARIIAPKHWDQRIACLFACDCTSRALRREHRAGREPDKRSWEALRVAHRYVEGQATKQELTAAAVAAKAAWAAIQDPGWTAGKTAARSAFDTTATTWYTTEIAAWAAWVTWNGSEAMVAAAWNATVAGPCAASAAWNATEAAAYVVSATWDGTGTEAKAAWRAERRWQANRLLQYLDGKRGV